MPQSRRQFKSGHLYEICFRARSGLPFTVSKYMKLLIESVLARAQRDQKVTLCHYIFLGSHPHILAVFKDAHQALSFYMEVEKKLTDAIKRLLGIPYLNLWKKTPRVIEICDKEAAVKMIAYYYANPAAANLVSNIEHYPGVSTWREFQANTTKLSAKVTHIRPWIRLPTIQKLPRRAVTERQDQFITEELISKNKKTEALEIFPNAWMKCFGVTEDEEVQRLNKRILERLRRNEDISRRWRQRKGKQLLGISKLKSQPLMAPHESKKNGRRVFCIASTKSLRIHVIDRFKQFCSDCRRCFKRWRTGEILVPWPPGAFLPPLPPFANALRVSYQD